MPADASVTSEPLSALRRLQRKQREIEEEREERERQRKLKEVGCSALIDEIFATSWLPVTTCVEGR